jgi:hypothetical protein
VGIGDLLEERLIHVHGHTYGMHAYILVVRIPRSSPGLAGCRPPAFPGDGRGDVLDRCIRGLHRPTSEYVPSS